MDISALTNYYLNKSNYEKKNSLINAFYPAFYSVTDEGFRFGTPARLKTLFNAEVKKKVKVKLIAQGYPDKEVTLLFRRVSEYLDAVN